jgi:hypothetical protein
VTVAVAGAAFGPSATGFGLPVLVTVWFPDLLTDLTVQLPYGSATLTGAVPLLGVGTVRTAPAVQPFAVSATRVKVRVDPFHGLVVVFGGRPDVMVDGDTSRPARGTTTFCVEPGVAVTPVKDPAPKPSPAVHWPAHTA